MVGRFNNFRDDLLVALAEAAQGTSQGLSPKPIADRAGLSYLAGWVRDAVRELEEQKFVTASYHIGSSADEGVSVHSVTGAGYDAAEAIKASQNDLLNPNYVFCQIEAPLFQPT